MLFLGAKIGKDKQIGTKSIFLIAQPAVNLKNG